MEIPDYMQPILQDTLARDNYRAVEMCRPSYLYRPKLSIDGNKWCALYGEDLQHGVAGFGDSPAEAYADFDKAWYRKLKEKKDDQ